MQRGTRCRDVDAQRLLRRQQILPPHLLSRVVKMLFAQVAAPADLPQNAAREARVKIRRVCSGECAAERNAAGFGAQ